MSGFQSIFSDILKWQVLQDADMFTDFIEKNKLTRDEQATLYETAKMIHAYKQTKDLSDLDITLFDKALYIKKYYEKEVLEKNLQNENKLQKPVDSLQTNNEQKETNEDSNKKSFFRYLFNWKYIAFSILLGIGNVIYKLEPTDHHRNFGGALLLLMILSATSKYKSGIGKQILMFFSTILVYTSIFFTTILIGMGFYFNSIINKTNKTTKDYVYLAKAYKRACYSSIYGSEENCIALGNLYTMGHGVKKDYIKAKKLYKKACDGGTAFGCTNLGILYVNGYGVRQDYLKAKELFEKACDASEPTGCTRLGILYGMEKDFQKYLEVKELLQKGCNGGDVDGCEILGDLYKSGEGVKQDYSKAKEFYKKACNLGSDKSCKYYKSLIK